MPKDEDYKAKEDEPFTQILPEPEHLVNVPSITGTIIGVKDLSYIIACSSCRKQTEPLETSARLGQCQVCKSIQMLDSCDHHWSLHVLF